MADSSLISGLVKKLKAAGSSVKRTFASFFKKIGNIAGKACAAMRPFFEKAYTFVRPFFEKVGTVFNKAAEKLRPFFEKAYTAVRPFFEKVGTVFNKAAEKLRSFFVKAGAFIASRWKLLCEKCVSLPGDKKLIAVGGGIVAAAAIVFAIGFIFPPAVEETDPPLTLEAEYIEETPSPSETPQYIDIFPEQTPAPTASPAPFTKAISKGDDDPLVSTVQSRLMALGYMDDDEPTEHFGSLTRDALTVFQKHNNLPANGVLQEGTYSVLFSASAEAFVLQVGDTGEDVTEVQERLYDLGYLGKDYITGTFGEKTETAVKDFQGNNKLEQDGKVGSATLEALYSEDVVGNFYKKGETSETVKLYQERLISLGYLSSSYEAAGKMDNQTIAAIKSFQEKNDLVADGCLGPSTMSKLDSDDAVAYALQIGMSGSSVKDLQKRLYKLGYLKKTQITGYYGEDTEEAVKNFQHRNGLKEDGQVGSKTLAKLNSDAAVKAKTKTATPKPTKKATAKATKKSSKTTAKATTKATATPKKATATPKPSTSKADQLVAVAKTKLGCTYVRGKKGPDTFDCSGFVYWCLNQVGVNQSYMTSIGWRKTSRYTRFTSLSEAKKGDVLVFSGSTDATGHVGLCIGSGQMIDASSGAGQVRITSLSGNYWKVHFICGYHIWG